MTRLRNLRRQLTRQRVSNRKLPLMQQSNSWLRRITQIKIKKFQLKKTGVYLCISTMMANVITWKAPVLRKDKLFTDKELMTLPQSLLLTEKWLELKVIKLLLNAAKVKHSWMEILELRSTQMITFTSSITKTTLSITMLPNSQKIKWKKLKKNSTSTQPMIAPSW